MSRSTRTWPRALAVVTMGVLLVALFALAGCGGGAAPQPTAVAQAPAEPTAAPAEPTAVVAPTDTVEPTATLAPTKAPEPTATATAEPSPTAVVVADASNCVTCHTSEETLQQLAKEEAPKESLSEGEG